MQWQGKSEIAFLAFFLEAKSCNNELNIRLN